MNNSLEQELLALAEIVADLSKRYGNTYISVWSCNGVDGAIVNYGNPIKTLSYYPEVQDGQA